MKIFIIRFMFERVQNQQNPRWSSTFSLHKNQSLVEGSEQETGLSTGLTATVYRVGAGPPTVVLPTVP